MTARSPRRYGYIPDLPDKRDRKFSIVKPVPLPDIVDLRGWSVPVYDQGQVGSCTGNSVEAAYRHELNRQDLPDFAGSRLFLYYNGRDAEGGAGTDGGAMIRDVIKGLATLGVCPESDWGYDEAQVLTKPSEVAYAAAQSHLALQYQRLSGNLNEMLQCLGGGVPFVFGFSVYQSFESDAVAASGVLEMPNSADVRAGIVGGHAVLCVGYDQLDQTFLVRNSWGPGWGQKGHFTMPFGYLTDPDLSDDRWSVTQVD